MSLTYRIRKVHLRIPDPDPIYEKTPSYVVDLLPEQSWMTGIPNFGPAFSSRKAAAAWMAEYAAAIPPDEES